MVRVEINALLERFVLMGSIFHMNYPSISMISHSLLYRACQCKSGTLGDGQNCGKCGSVCASGKKCMNG